jgi:hypothetical protein
MLIKILILLILIYIIINIINNHFLDNFTNVQYPTTVAGKSYVKAVPEKNNSLAVDGINNKIKVDDINNKIKVDDKNNKIKFEFQRKQDYDEVLKNENSDLVYYYNDSIQQDKITECADDIVNMIDKIDYADIKTGIQKCEEKCDGTCYELGYTGVAACYPEEKQKFFWGSLYKNPTFTYGLKNGQEPYYKYNIQNN